MTDDLGAAIEAMQVALAQRCRVLLGVGDVRVALEAALPALLAAGWRPPDE